VIVNVVIKVSYDHLTLVWRFGSLEWGAKLECSDDSGLLEYDAEWMSDISQDCSIFEILETLTWHTVTSQNTWIIGNTHLTHRHIPEHLSHWKHSPDTPSHLRTPESLETLPWHTITSQNTWIIGNTPLTHRHIPEHLTPQNLKSHMNAVIYRCLLVWLRLLSLYCVDIWDVQSSRVYDYLHSLSGSVINKERDVTLGFV
jgi:hypothetical protein